MIGFNEAAALLPRILQLMLRAAHDRYLCFNEAAALLPRIHRPCACQQHYEELASMRPRHYCRGYQADRLATEAANAASFNEAAALLPRIHAMHRLFSDVAFEASMRPRHYCRGYAWNGVRWMDGARRFNEAAALLPRIPGNETCITKLPSLLQ